VFRAHDTRRLPRRRPLSAGWFPRLPAEFRGNPKYGSKFADLTRQRKGGMALQ